MCLWIYLKLCLFALLCVYVCVCVKETVREFVCVICEVPFVRNSEFV